jgi:hypothetical protein
MTKEVVSQLRKACYLPRRMLSHIIHLVHELDLNDLHTDQLSGENRSHFALKTTQ